MGGAQTATCYEQIVGLPRKQRPVGDLIEIAGPEELPIHILSSVVIFDWSSTTGDRVIEFGAVPDVIAGENVLAFQSPGFPHTDRRSRRCQKCVLKAWILRYQESNIFLYLPAPFHFGPGQRGRFELTEPSLPLLLEDLAAVLGALLLLACGLGAVPFLKLKSAAHASLRRLEEQLPDALDLMIVCVEAGLALNQALLRVAEEIRHVSRLTSEEFSLVNYEIRAGVPREEALRNLGERTGVADIRSLIAMLIQTDRFGTSIAQALRVHSDTLRTKRRQRAEEAAAKTTIKLVFPLATCIFPALFVVILGPALVQIYRTLSGLR